MESTSKANAKDNLVLDTEELERYIGLRISEDLHHKLLAKSNQLRRKKSETVRLAIEEFVNQTEDTS